MNFRISKSKTKDLQKLIFLIILLAFSVYAISRPVYGATFDKNKCTTCHTTEVRVVKAIDTISMDNDTCYKCHDPKHRLEYKGLDVHGIHNGKPIPRSDYLERHPKVRSEDCGKCHIGTSQCTNCHSKNMPHAGSRLDCTSCHGAITNLFKHPEIKLDKHDFFKYANQTACTTCHDANKDYLTLINKAKVPITEPHRLCYQCHSNIYRDWISGMHFANKTIAAAKEHYEDLSLEETWERDNTCTICHDAHDTEKMLWIPPTATPTPEKTRNEIWNIGSSLTPLTHIAIMLTFSLAVVLTYIINLKIKR